jgi:membrane-associated phospholipid phosphatase
MALADLFPQRDVSRTSAWVDAAFRSEAPDAARLARVTAAMCLCLLLVQLPLLIAVGFTVNWSAIGSMLALCVLFFGVSEFAFHRLCSPFIGTVAAGVVHFSIINVSMLVLSYVAVAMDFPFQDKLFRAADVALGFDWQNFAAFVTERPTLLYGLSWCYSMLDKQALLIGPLAALFLRFREFQIMILAWIIAAVATVFISVFLPAKAAFFEHGLVEAMQQSMVVSSGYIHLGVVDAIRSGHLTDPYAELVGIVAFPSFHAASGVMLAWMCWHMPVIRWPLLIINLGLIVATPMVGGHYLVDVIAGIVLGACAIPVAKRLASAFAPR